MQAGEVERSTSASAVLIYDIFFDDEVNPLTVREVVGPEFFGRQLKQSHGPFSCGLFFGIAFEPRILDQIMQRADAVKIALQTASIAAEEYVSSDQVIVRSVAGIARVFLLRKSEQVVLEQHCVRVARVKSPLAMVVREVVDQDDVVSLLASLAEISVHHDAGPRSVRFRVSRVAAGDVETLHNDVVRRAEQNHPVRNPGGLVDHDITRFAHRLKVNIAPFGGTRLFVHDETGISTRHHCNKVSSAGNICCLLQGPVDGVYLIAANRGSFILVPGVEIQAANANLPWPLTGTIHHENTGIPLLDVQCVLDPFVRVLRFVENWRRRRTPGCRVVRQKG